MSTLNLMYLRMKTNVSYSPFNVPECEYYNAYDENENLLGDRVVIKVDALQALRSKFDKGMFLDRSLLYSLVSGSLPPGTKYNELLVSFYKKFPAFANYIDGAVQFQDEDRNLLQNIMIPIRNKIDDFKMDVKGEMYGKGGRVVLDTHDYLYIAFKKESFNLDTNIIIDKVIG